MKEIKFSSLTFSEIGVNGLINHVYEWNKEAETLIHFIDGDERERFSKSEARIKIQKLIGVEKKDKTQKIVEVVQQKKNVIPSEQLKLF